MTFVSGGKMSKKNVVVIDDCKLTLAIARDILESAGYEVFTAESGIEANVYIYAKPGPDLILIDVVMPMLQGDKKVQLLKVREATRSIPVLLMSSKQEAELSRLAASSGADGYITKPLQRERLLQAVEAVL